MLFCSITASLSSVLSAQSSVKSMVCLEYVYFVPGELGSYLPEDPSNIALEQCKFLHDRDELRQLLVLLIIKPTHTWQCVLRLEKVRVWRVVHDNYVLDRPSKPGEVFDIEFSLL